jgi:Rieske Fe-S protein
MHGKRISRRKFIVEVTGGSLLAVLGLPLLAQAQAPQAPAEPPAPDAPPTPPAPAAPAAPAAADMRTLDLQEAAFKDLNEAGKGVYLPLGKNDKPLIVWRQSQTVVKAFSSKCTHKGCEVKLPKDGELKCPCHWAKFGPDGKPTRGPAKTALPEYPAELKDGKVIVTLKPIGA